MNLTGHNICVLDLETLYSADDCRVCMLPEQSHTISTHTYERIGWQNKRALGLSIGCWWDYAHMALHWFDVETVERTIGLFVQRQPLLVSFNGIQFDFALMRALVRHQHESATEPVMQAVFAAHNAECDAFKLLCTRSYDILREIWKVDPTRRFERGLNSLGAISVANGYGEKAMDGAQAPRRWRIGRYAEVIAYNVGDVLKTKALFEQIIATGSILRGDGQPIALPSPRLEEHA